MKKYNKILLANKIPDSEFKKQLKELMSQGRNKKC